MIPPAPLILIPKNRIFLSTKWETRVFNDPSRRELWKRNRKRDLYIDEFFEAEDINHVLNTGGSLLFSLMRGAGGTVWSNANAHIGVGDDSTAVADAQTGIIAAVNVFYEPMDATFPSEALSGRQHVYEATFESADANFSWQEFTLENTSDGSGVAFNRLVQNQGTKLVGQERTVTLKLTFPGA